MAAANGQLEDVLNAIVPNGDDPRTVRNYLKDLLKQLWLRGSDFSSKRPFGDSNWQHDVYHALVKDDIIPGNIDADGELASFDVFIADELIVQAIDYLWATD